MNNTKKIILLLALVVLFVGFIDIAYAEKKKEALITESECFATAKSAIIFWKTKLIQTNQQIIKICEKGGELLFTQQATGKVKVFQCSKSPGI